MARPRRFHFLNCDNPFLSYREDEFAQTFGFGKDNVHSIVHMVRDALEARIERRTVLSPENKVLIFLDYIRSNSLQRVMGKKRHSGCVIFTWQIVQATEICDFTTHLVSGNCLFIPIKINLRHSTALK